MSSWKWPDPRDRLQDALSNTHPNTLYQPIMVDRLVILNAIVEIDRLRGVIRTAISELKALGGNWEERD